MDCSDISYIISNWSETHSAKEHWPTLQSAKMLFLMRHGIIYNIFSWKIPRPSTITDEIGLFSAGFLLLGHSARCENRQLTESHTVVWTMLLSPSAITYTLVIYHIGYTSVIIISHTSVIIIHQGHHNSVTKTTYRVTIASILQLSPASSNHATLMTA